MIEPADRKPLFRLGNLAGAFARGKRGAIAVEMAFILPIFFSFAFLTYDAGTVYTQYKRGVRHYYSLGDIISAQTQDLTCSKLDRIAELVYESYAAGNWARRPRPSGVDFNRDGALDFRFRLQMIRVVKLANGQLRGYVEWDYRRDTTLTSPGVNINVPAAMRIEGLRYVLVDGSLFIAPALNYLGVFDYHPAANQTHKSVAIDRYFPLRFVTNVGLTSTPTDPFTNKCGKA